ncbi:hypothetical protein [Candidatus Harpocratesius sp.]
MNDSIFSSIKQKTQEIAKDNGFTNLSCRKEIKFVIQSFFSNYQSSNESYYNISSEFESMTMHVIAIEDSLFQKLKRNCSSNDIIYIDNPLIDNLKLKNLTQVTNILFENSFNLSSAFEISKDNLFLSQIVSLKFTKFPISEAANPVIIISLNNSQKNFHENVNIGNNIEEFIIINFQKELIFKMKNEQLLKKLQYFNFDIYKNLKYDIDCLNSFEETNELVNNILEFQQHLSNFGLIIILMIIFFFGIPIFKEYLRSQQDLIQKFLNYNFSPKKLLNFNLIESIFLLIIGVLMIIFTEIFIGRFFFKLQYSVSTILNSNTFILSFFSIILFVIIKMLFIGIIILKSSKIREYSLKEATFNKIKIKTYDILTLISSGAIISLIIIKSINIVKLINQFALECLIYSIIFLFIYESGKIIFYLLKRLQEQLYLKKLRKKSIFFLIHTLNEVSPVKSKMNLLIIITFIISQILFQSTYQIQDYTIDEISFNLGSEIVSESLNMKEFNQMKNNISELEDNFNIMVRINFSFSSDFLGLHENFHFFGFNINNSDLNEIMFFDFSNLKNSNFTSLLAENKSIILQKNANFFNIYENEQVQIKIPSEIKNQSDYYNTTISAIFNYFPSISHLDYPTGDFVLITSIKNMFNLFSSKFIQDYAQIKLFIKIRDSIRNQSLEDIQELLNLKLEPISFRFLSSELQSPKIKLKSDFEQFSQNLIQFLLGILFLFYLIFYSKEIYAQQKNTKNLFTIFGGNRQKLITSNILSMFSSYIINICVFFFIFFGIEFYILQILFPNEKYPLIISYNKIFFIVESIIFFLIDLFQIFYFINQTRENND